MLTRTVRYGTSFGMNEILTRKPAISDEGVTPNTPTPREQEVLSAVLDLMVEEGDGFSMSSVARRASCSKETLYRWYGDRDGLLTATVRWQASKVFMPELPAEQVSLKVFSNILCEFAQSWLTVLTGDVSIALNRLAVSHAGNGKTSLGRIVLENGPLAMRDRLTPILEMGIQNGFIETTVEEAFRLFFGLVVGDTQIRVLLGEEEKPEEQKIQGFAREAVRKFLKICEKSS
ncbi:MAG: TetR/AcrR family transcriptional regulator C-terminal domain-containing protein [Rhizobiaceae bacterium]